jgi:glutamyl-tRNA synthetase
VHDLLHGTFVQDVAREVGDFVVLRNDGVPSYQLAVVVDDAETGITHVLRGDDLLGSTPRQIQLCEALSLPVPTYAHVPLLLGPDGKRLAKRAGTPTLSELRERSIAPERLVGLLAGWAGLGDGRPVGLGGLLPRFALERLPRAPVAVNPVQVNAVLLGAGPA